MVVQFNCTDRVLSALYVCADALVFISALVYNCVWPQRQNTILMRAWDSLSTLVIFGAVCALLNSMLSSRSVSMYVNSNFSFVRVLPNLSKTSLVNSKWPRFIYWALLKIWQFICTKKSGSDKIYFIECIEEFLKGPFLGLFSTCSLSLKIIN